VVFGLLVGGGDGGVDDADDPEGALDPDVVPVLGAGQLDQPALAHRFR
jgi:hypothetical protein